MFATIGAIEYYLPSHSVATADLASEFPEWSVEKIDKKTGISTRHIAAPDECASDLAFAAAQKLFNSGTAQPADIDCLLLCTQSPDYFLPTTACLLQDRLGLPTSCFAIDYNQGCSGFVYGLGLAKGMIESGQVRKVLLITAETYSKHIHPRDKSVRTIFGDAAAATLIEGIDSPGGTPPIGPFVWGTDGSGGKNLIVPTGGMRRPRSAETAVETVDQSGNRRTQDNLFMDGPEIFSFTLREVPKSFHQLLSQANLTPDQIDMFVFHQANRYMLDSLRMVLNIPADRFHISMKNCGNTVSSTIPIALKHASTDGSLQSGNLVMLLGFGVGYSWGAALVRWA